MKKLISFLLSSALLASAFFVYSHREKEVQASFFGDAERGEVNLIGLLRRLIG